ncbi:BadF/BadG/BcrA/BcrD ATPase family protein [Pyrococcus kukulkanii]|uniref:BadF/BadG/BcrA/BcrD ATPase family protein n=1 Tax=Pyrococcus kukulkanii TaxID=1609559 RepID=A0ABV4T6J4_9EURY
MMFLGIDAGATKTEAVVIDKKERILGVGYGGPANLNSSPLQVVRNSLIKAIVEALPEKSNKDNIKSACISIAGTLGGNTKIIREILNEVLPKTSIIIKRDYEIAHIACFNFKPGVVFIAGTGSIAYGVNEKGERVRVGGWGHLVGDEGSGYWVGQEGVRAGLKFYDGRGQPTILYNYLKEYLGIENDSPDSIIRAIYSSENKKTLIAGFAPYVVKAAREGDQVARLILERAAEEIVSSYLAAVQRLKFESIQGKLGIAGGFYFGARDILKPILLWKLGRVFGDIVDLKEPIMSNAEAAARVALKTSTNISQKTTPHNYGS